MISNQKEEDRPDVEFSNFIFNKNNYFLFAKNILLFDLFLEKEL
jgi:hypothetical protein